MNKKEEERCLKMILKIDACMLRALKSEPLNTDITFTTEWIVKQRNPAHGIRKET